MYELHKVIKIVNSLKIKITYTSVIWYSVSYSTCEQEGRHEQFIPLWMSASMNPFVPLGGLSFRSSAIEIKI